MKQTRRTFLRNTSISATLLASSGGISRWGMALPAAAKNRSWVTSGEMKFKEQAFPGWQADSGGGAEIEINAAEKFQSMLGFGGAFTDASCYLLSQMEAGPRRSLLAELVGREGLGFSMARTCTGSTFCRF